MLPHRKGSKLVQLNQSRISSPLRQRVKEAVSKAIFKGNLSHRFIITNPLVFMAICEYLVLTVVLFQLLGEFKRVSSKVQRKERFKIDQYQGFVLKKG